MKFKLKRTIALALATATAVALTGCGKKKETSNADLTYWTALNANASQITSSYGDTEFGKKLMEDTGITVEYIHPPQGQHGEKFNLMIAGNDLPDIIEYNWYTYTGGPERALEEGIIRPLDIEKEAPNLYKYLKEHPEIDKMCKTDDGVYWGFPFIRGDRFLQTSAGIIIREDWLNDLGLDMPETIDEWTNVLTQFKEKKGSRAPLTMTTANFGQSYSAFISAYGITDGFYVDNGVVKMGAMQPEYKEFLQKMNEWYKAGLLDADFMSTDGSIIQTNILNGVSGATVGSVGGNLGKWMAAATDENFTLAGAPNVVMKKGDKPEFGNFQFPVTGTTACITRDCKDVEKALKLLDYGYSEEGLMLFNFGIEGESYEMKDGYPTYTEKIKNNPDGLSMAAALSNYTMSTSEGIFIQDKRYMEQYAQLPQQQDAITTWSQSNMAAHLLPSLSLTPEQINSMSSKIENINTYKSEKQVEFICGTTSLDQFDAYVKELENRGALEYIAMLQEAYDRYQDR